MKKFLIALSLFASLSSPAKALYTTEQPDCTKSKTYITDIIKNGYLPIITFNDTFQNGNFHLFYHPTKKNEILVFATNEKICLVGTGVNVSLDVNTSPATFRNFFDDALKNTLNATKDNK